MVIQVFLQHIVIFQIIALLDGAPTEEEIKISC